MSLSDPIGDMLARIKNSLLRNHKKIELPSSKFKTKIADILKSEGYILDYEIKTEQNKASGSRQQWNCKRSDYPETAEKHMWERA